MARPASRAGFTLIELLIALLISGILATILLQLFLGQSRFAQLQTAREEVQQNARAALEIITSELRNLGRDAIVAAGPHSIHFYSPRATGLMCRHHESHDLAAIFPSVALTGINAEPALAGQLALPPYGGAEGWAFLNVTDVTEARLSDATDWCRQINPAYPGTTAASESAARMFAGVPHPGIGSPDTLQRVDRVYLYTKARYAVGADAGGEQWILRGAGADELHQLAGPVDGDSGLVFAYLDSDGQPITDLADPDERNRIARIEVTVVTRSHAEFGGVPQRDSASTTVHLRN
jgi:prepilin-type N-terminal cleavage/methylation domain-containing protein